MNNSLVQVFQFLMFICVLLILSAVVASVMHLMYFLGTKMRKEKIDKKSVIKIYANTSYIVVGLFGGIPLLLTLWKYEAIRSSLILISITGVLIFILIKKRTNSGIKTIKEIKCTCQACGNIWFYLPKERLQNIGERMINDANARSNASNDALCCTGCALPLFMPKQPVQKIQDLHRCAKCGSSAVTREKVTHEIHK